MTERAWAAGPPDAARRIRLVQLGADTLTALADGDLDAANRTSAVVLTPYFVDPAWRSVWRRRSTQIDDDPGSAGWITGVIWDDDRQLAVGRAGFHGPPSADGMLEVGYAVDPAHRRQGYARAALETLLARAAAEPGVRTVRACVRPDNDASQRLVCQYGFLEVGVQEDYEDGVETVYEVVVASNEG